MLIEVRPDIFSSAAEGDETCIDLLHLIATGMRRNKHYYVIPRLQAYNLSGKLSKYEMQLFTEASKDQDGQAISKIAEWKVIVSCQNPPADLNPKHIWFNPKKDNAFEIYEETHLLCENLQDVEFYNFILNHYKKVTARGRGCAKHKSSYLSRNGGGSTTVDVIRDEIDRGEHLCLTITDSDIRYSYVEIQDGEENEIKGKIGDTTQGILDLQNEIPAEERPYFHHYHLQEHREAENLIPHSILTSKQMKTGNTEIKKILTDAAVDTRWFDFKEGLQYRHLWGDRIYEYWKGQLSQLTPPKDITLRDTLKQGHASAKDYVESFKNHPNPQANAPILAGWGNKILETSTAMLKQVDIKRIQLTAAQQREWTALGSLLYHWTLSKAYRNP